MTKKKIEAVFGNDYAIEKAEEKLKAEGFIFKRKIPIRLEIFVNNKEEIERAFGESLIWERLDTKRACRISKQLAIGGYRDKEKWPEIHDQMIDAMIRLERALKPFIMKINI